LNELIEKVPPPEIPEEWNYDESVEKVRGNIYKIRYMTKETVGEMWIAKAHLDGRGRPSIIDKFSKKDDKCRSFSQYCQECGPDIRTVERWFVLFGWVENVHFLSESPEWNTPRTIINKTIQLFGSIDLDPCSNSYTNPNVPAELHYIADDNSLMQPWHGRVYMNPPYGNEIGSWTEKLRAEYEKTRTTQGIALVPSRTDTEWFRNLGAYPRCFIWGRLKFSEYENSAPFPSMVVYMGKNTGGFVETFCDMGDIYARVT